MQRKKQRNCRKHGTKKFKKKEDIILEIIGKKEKENRK
jgi:hypothetical protein